MRSFYSGYVGMRGSQIVDSFECPECNKTFTQKANLRRHLKFIHTGKKPFVCDVCNKAFNRKGNMEVHRLTHLQC